MIGDRGLSRRRGGPYVCSHEASGSIPSAPPVRDLVFQISKEAKRVPRSRSLLGSSRLLVCVRGCLVMARRSELSLLSEGLVFASVGVEMSPFSDCLAYLMAGVIRVGFTDCSRTCAH